MSGGDMKVSARVAYGLGALVDLAAANGPVKGDVLARRHAVSVGFLEGILAELRRHGVIHSKRGVRGGYWLARPADEITVADVIRVLDGAGHVESNAPLDGQLPVWQTISEATMAAAATFTLATVAAERGPRRG